MLAVDFESAVLILFYQSFSWYQRVLRKITVDNSARYISKSEQTKEAKPKPIKTGSLPRKQNKSISQKS